MSSRTTVGKLLWNYYFVHLKKYWGRKGCRKIIIIIICTLYWRLEGQPKRRSMNFVWWVIIDIKIIGETRVEMLLLLWWSCTFCNTAEQHSSCQPPHLWVSGWWRWHWNKCGKCQISFWWTWSSVQQNIVLVQLVCELNLNPGFFGLDIYLTQRNIPTRPDPTSHVGRWRANDPQQQPSV